MKVLYASCRYDPLDRDAGSGVDFNIYEALKKKGFELQIVGPFKDQPAFIERVYRKVHRVFSRKLTAKFSEAYLRASARAVAQAAREFQPDAIFSHNLIPLVYLQTALPVVYKSDAVLWNMHDQWPTYSRLELLRMLRWERTALSKSTRIITASRWAAEALTGHYRIPTERILVLPIPSSLPMSEIPREVEHATLDPHDLHLLAVAKDYHLKGIDIVEETVEILQSKGIHATLRVAGHSRPGSDNVKYLGLFRKDIPVERAEYLAQYQWADFLLHPARYEAAGIVCGEAAAFGVPTITNAIGGLATTVEDGVSGVVLPISSPAQAYAGVICHYLDNPGLYTRLRETTRERYERELNWNAAGDKISNLIREAVEEKRNGSVAQ